MLETTTSQFPRFTKSPKKIGTPYNNALNIFFPCKVYIYISSFAVVIQLLLKLEILHLRMRYVKTKRFTKKLGQY